MRKFNLPLTDKQIKSLKIGEQVLLNGVIYTGRDQAHKRLVKDIGKDRGKGRGKGKGKENFLNIKNNVIYYCGPTPAPKGRVIGSCGPTTSSRMDDFTPLLISRGLKVTIGKGRRGEKVVKAIKQYRGVYFVTYAGCGALLSKFIQEAKPVLYPELGPEAVFKLKVKDFPVIVAVDSSGNDIYNR